MQGKKHNFIKTIGSGIIAAIDHLISTEFNDYIADVVMLHVRDYTTSGDGLHSGIYIASQACHINTLSKDVLLTLGFLKVCGIEVKEDDVAPFFLLNLL